MAIESKKKIWKTGNTKKRLNIFLTKVKANLNKHKQGGTDNLVMIAAKMEVKCQIYLSSSRIMKYAFFEDLEYLAVVLIDHTINIYNSQTFIQMEKINKPL